MRGYPSPLGTSPFCLKPTVFQFRSGPLHWLLSPAVPFLEAGPAVLPGSKVQGLTFLSLSLLSLGPVISSLRMPPSLCVSLSPSWFPLDPCCAWLAVLCRGSQGWSGRSRGQGCWNQFSCCSITFILFSSLGFLTCHSSTYFIRWFLGLKRECTQSTYS